MKKNMILGLAVLGMTLTTLMPSSFADTTNTKELCMNMTGVEFGTNKVLGTAQCDVTQTMSLSQLASSWTCTFDGKPAGTLNTTATWISDGNAEQAQTIFYDIFPQEDLGAYLLKGLNMTAVTAYGAFLEVVLDATPHTSVPDLMFMTNGYTPKYDGLSFTSMQNGSCASQK